MKKHGQNLSILGLLFLLHIQSWSQGLISIGQVSSCPNSVVLVPVTISNIYDLGAFSLYITYDPAVLSPVSSPDSAVVDIHSALLSGYIYHQVISNPFPMLFIQWSDSLASPLSVNTGTLFYLKFHYTTSAVQSVIHFNPDPPQQTAFYDFTSGQLMNASLSFTDGGVILNQVPTAAANPASQDICSGTNCNIAISNPNNIPGTTFGWTASLVSGAASGFSNGGGNSIHQALTNTSTNCSYADVKYTIIPYANGCTGTVVYIHVNVHPVPTVVASPANLTICNGEVSCIALDDPVCGTAGGGVNLALSPDGPGTVTGTMFSWTASLLSGLASGYANGSGTSICQTLMIYGTTPAVLRYTIFPGADGCYGNSVNVNVTIDMAPNAVVITDENICSGSNTNISITNSANIPGLTYSWTASLLLGTATGYSNGSGTSISQILTNPANAPAQVRYTIAPPAGCSGTPATTYVGIEQVPYAGVSPSAQTIYSGATTSISIINTPWIYMKTFTWTASLISGLATGFSNGSGNSISQTLVNSNSSTAVVRFTITATANGCTGPPKTVDVSILGTTGSIQGTLTYDNIQNSPMSNVNVLLKRNGILVNQDSTDSSGSYLFQNLQPGNYTLDALITKPWTGVNAADALVILNHTAGIDLLSGLRLRAADVNLSGYVNSVDALKTTLRFTGLITSFAAGDWVITRDTVIVSPGVTLAKNLKALCVGDVNGSGIPGAK